MAMPRKMPAAKASTWKEPKRPMMPRISPKNIGYWLLFSLSACDK